MQLFSSASIRNWLKKTNSRSIANILFRYNRYSLEPELTVYIVDIKLSEQQQQHI